jgi:hypothetical protein
MEFFKHLFKNREMLFKINSNKQNQYLYIENNINYI